PPTTADGERGVRPKHGAPPILFCLPGSVLFIALLNDMFTFGVVMHSALWHALIQTVIAFVLFLIIVQLTWHCHELRKESAALWQRYFHKITAEPALTPAS